MRTIELNENTRAITSTSARKASRNTHLENHLIMLAHVEALKR
jgi:hypothetical protein